LTIYGYKQVVNTFIYEMITVVRVLKVRDLNMDVDIHIKHV